MEKVSQLIFTFGASEDHLITTTTLGLCNSIQLRSGFLLSKLKYLLQTKQGRLSQLMLRWIATIYFILFLCYSLTQTNGQGLRKHLKHLPVASLQTGSVTRNLLKILLKHTVKSAGSVKSFKTGFKQRFTKDLQVLLSEMIIYGCIHYFTHVSSIT